MALAWPNVSTLNLWGYLPFSLGLVYTSVSNSGNTTNVLAMATSPVRIIERQVSFGVYKYALTTFKVDPAIWSMQFPGVDPKPRDTLVDADGKTWRVYRSLAPPHVGSLWRLVCNRLIIESALCDTISIKKPVDSTDAYLSPITTQGTPSIPETNIPCRIQFDRQDVEDFQGVQFYRNWYKIYVQNLDDDLVIGAVITATSGQYNGTTFRVLSNDNIEELEELEMLTVTIDPVQ